MPENNNKSKYPYTSAVRLHYRRDYFRLFSNSECLKLSECVIFRTINEYKHARLGVTIKAKVNSVERNQLKRQIRESFRMILSKLGPFDFNVVIPAYKTVSPSYLRHLRECLLNEWVNAVPQRSIKKTV